MPIRLRIAVGALGIAGGIYFLIASKEYLGLSIALIAVGILSICLNFWVEKRGKKQ